MTDIQAHKKTKVWSVYVMAAPAGSGATYFKVGRSSNVPGRIRSVQTGCPLRITKVWVIKAWSNGASQGMESRMHKLLRPFHSHGEWFAMRTDDPDHKAAMNAAFAEVCGDASQMHPVKWRLLDVAELLAAVSALNAEQAQERQAFAVKRARKGAALMAATGRRIL